MPRAVILTALPVEYLAVRAHLTNPREEVHPQGTIYERGAFAANGQTWDVGIVEIGAGNSGAALEAERAIAYFKPDVLFFVGIAGGIKDVAIGDVVAATKVYSYESGKVGEQFFICPALGQSAHALVQRAKAEARKDEWLKRLSGSPASQPRVFVAPIAAGEKVIASKESDVFNFIRASYNDAIAVEMEGFGFLNAAFAHPEVKAIVIRGISDLIEDKNVDDPVEGTEEQRQERASYNASAFAFEILVKLEYSHNLPTSPTSFQTLIQDKIEGFVGREYIFNAIHTFIDENSKGYFTLISDPGMGKSAILAKYVQDTGCIVHFNVQQQGSNQSYQFLESVCKQLIARYQLSYHPLPSSAIRDGEFLGKLLDEVAQRRNGKAVVIAIDALDEVDPDSYRKDANILYLPLHLPDGVYFIMTKRRGVPVPFTTYAPTQTISLLDYQTDSQQDIYAFISNRVHGSEKLRQQINERREEIPIFTDKIASKSENNFMYLRYILQDLEKGLYKDLSLESFPQGLQGYYDFHWQRMGMTAQPLPDAKIKIVYILGEVKQPVSRQQICDFSKEDSRTVQTVLNEWEQFLHELLKDNQSRYSVYHTSFRDFLRRKDILEKTGLSLPGIHQLIAQNLLNKWRNRQP